MVYYRGEPIENYVLLLLWNNFQIDTKLMQTNFFNSIKISIFQRFVKSSEKANQKDFYTNQISSDCSNESRQTIEQVQNFLNNREKY